MKPKPLSSLNHFTVPVAICSLPGDRVLRNAGGAGGNYYERWALSRRADARHDALQSSRTGGAGTTLGPGAATPCLTICRPWWTNVAFRSGERALRCSSWAVHSATPADNGWAEEVRMAAKRLQRLKDLVDQLERLPASPDRDRVLAEVRSRAVDVDTGVTPRAMLPVREPTPPPLAPKPRPERYRPRAITRTPSPARPVQQARPAAAPARAGADDLGVLLWDDRLSLEDSPELAPLPHAPRNPDGSVPPWALGLRG